VGFALNWLAAAHTRKQVSLEDLERERRQRELLVAERLDEALVRSSVALDDAGPDVPLDDRYRHARAEWENAWVAYSSRLRQPDLLRRYESVGKLLLAVSLGDLTTQELPRHVVARAIANARASLAYFMRGEEDLPPTAFPDPEDLRRLIREGDYEDDHAGPLKTALAEYPEPQFHPAPTSGRDQALQRRRSIQ
jgi:hypothetical protein